MRIRYVSGTLGMFFALYSNAQVVSDTIKSVDLSEVVVTGSYRHAQEKKTTLTVRGTREQIMEKIQGKNPLFCEILPLTLEEIFISETEVAGYEVKNLFF